MRYLTTDQPDLVLSRAAGLVVLGQQPPESLPTLATDALVRGLDSPSLRELAGVRAADYQEARDPFQRVCRELGIRIPTPDQARWSLAYEWAEAIVTGELSPVVGARRIWWEAWEHLGRPNVLTPFVTFASESEDDPDHQSEYEDDIRLEAVRLLAQHP